MRRVPSFRGVQHVLDEAIEARVFPGAVVEIGRRDDPLETIARGALRYDAGAARTRTDTVYDLASLTKVLAATPLVLQGVIDRRIRLEDRVSRWIAGWTGADRESVTIQDLLEHCSGLPAHRRYFESLSGRVAFESAIVREPLAYLPRWQSIYSDPGFMLLGFAIEHMGESSLDDLFNRWRERELGGNVELGYLPTAPAGRIAPTEVTDQGEVLGRVHDENAAALGGVAAHAGLFGTADAVGRAARWWLAQWHVGDAARRALLHRFVQKSSVPGSSRALGWDTMLPTSSCGTRMSHQAIGHTGFTGTSLWIDPGRDLYVAFLSNRVHPSRAGEGMQQVRAALHDAVADDLA